MINVRIDAGMEKYTPLMSSVPGFPLTAIIYSKKGEEIKCKYHWTANHGNILTWEAPAGKVKEFGKDFKSEVEKIYWSPLSQDDNNFS